MELVMKTFKEQVDALWEAYWVSFNEAEQLRRGDTNRNAQQLRRLFAESNIKNFHKLERESQDRDIDSASLLLYKIGFSLYGDMGDDKSALKYLRAFLASSPDDKNLTVEQSYAVEFTLHVYEKDQEELAKTLALIRAANNNAGRMRSLRQSIIAAVASHFDAGAPIVDSLYAEICRVCCLVVEHGDRRTFGEVFQACNDSQEKR